MTESKLCSIGGCGKPVRTRGWCATHYSRWRRRGDATISVPPERVPGKAAKFFDEVVLKYDGADCLIWPFSKSRGGRAQINVGGRPQYVQRLACQFVHGDPPSQAHQAAHSCGNGHLSCVNPRHIRWATPIENAADKEAHGTVPRGEKHKNARLTEGDVRAIKIALQNMGISEVAKKWGVSRGAIAAIKRGENWRWLS